jgi:hypothetical protein
MLWRPVSELLWRRISSRAKFSELLICEWPLFEQPLSELALSEQPFFQQRFS